MTEPSSKLIVDPAQGKWHRNARRPDDQSQYLMIAWSWPVYIYCYDQAPASHLTELFLHCHTFMGVHRYIMNRHD